MPPYLHQCRHTSSAAPDLQSSILLCLHVYTPVARLQNSRASYVLPPCRRYTYTLKTSRPQFFSMSLRLQRVSRIPYLHIATLQRDFRDPYLQTYLHVRTPTARLQCSIPPLLHSSTSLHLLRSSRAPYLHASMPPYLYISMSLRLQRGPRAPELHTSMPPRPRSVARLQSSGAPDPIILPSYAYGAPPALHMSISLHLYAYIAPPEPQSSTPLRLHVVTPTARLQTSRPPCLHVAAPATIL